MRGEDLVVLADGFLSAPHALGLSIAKALLRVVGYQRSCAVYQLRHQAVSESYTARDARASWGEMFTTTQARVWWQKTPTALKSVPTYCVDLRLWGCLARGARSQRCPASQRVCAEARPIASVAGVAESRQEIRRQRCK